jgi:hypothetical protein
MRAVVDEDWPDNNIPLLPELPIAHLPLLSRQMRNLGRYYTTSYIDQRWLISKGRICKQAD